MKVVCYYPNWTHYRTGDGKYTVEDIDPSFCTHLMYSFVVLDPTTHIITVHDSWLDIDLGNIQKFINLKSQYPHVKLIVALGGWNDSRELKYSVLLVNAAKRSAFVKHAVKFIREFGFDGLDLDYEYPGHDGVATDREGFISLVKELKDAFIPHGLELTAAVSASKATIDNGYDVEEVCKHLDAVHLMCYDMHGSWDQEVDHHATLYGEQGDQLTVDFAVKYWLSKGCPRKKLVVGIPTYGRTWTLTGPSTTIKSAGSGPGSAGPVTREPGFLAFHEVCQNLHTSGWTKVSDPNGRMGPYAYKDNQWVGYDDPDMAAVKAMYIVSNQLGGAMFWDLPSDDFRNKYGGGHYPIIKSVCDIFNNEGPCASRSSASSYPASTDSYQTASASSSNSCALPKPIHTSNFSTDTVLDMNLATPGPCLFEVKSQTMWPGHIQASLIVTMPVDVTSYNLRVETDHPIKNFVLWDAEVQPNTGQKFTVTNKHWFDGKKEGQVLELGFQMEFGTGEVPCIVAVSLT